MHQFSISRRCNVLAISSSSAHPSQRSASCAASAAPKVTCRDSSSEGEASSAEVPYSSRNQQQSDVARVAKFCGTIHSQIKITSLAAGLSLGAAASARADSLSPLTTAHLAADAPILSLPEGFAIPENLSFDQLPLLLSSLPALAGFELAVPAMTFPALDISLPALSFPTALTIPEILVSAVDKSWMAGSS